MTEPSVCADSARWRGPLVGAALLSIVVVALFFDFFVRQCTFAIKQQADWGHTLAVPFIAGYFVYLNRERILAKPFRTTWIAFLPILAGVAWYMICIFGPQQLWHHNLRAVGVAATIGGLVLLFCGWRAMAWLWFPLLYVFVFGQTISERLMEIVTFRLQDITARGAHLVLMILPGLDVDRTGNTLVLFDGVEERPLNVAEACSGMRMLMAFLALGVAMAYTGLHRFWQRALLVIAGIPTAIAVNILRVVTLALLAQYDADLAGGEFHSFIGLVWLLPAFLIYLGVMWIVRNLVAEVAPE